MDMEVSASVMCADQGRLLAQVEELQSAGVDRFHVDIMDGVFVPNFTLGVPAVEALRRGTALPIEAHLMVIDPEKHLETFIRAGADILIVHAEAAKEPLRIAGSIRAAGKKAGVALNPATPPEVLEYLLPWFDLVLVMTVEPGFAGQKLVPGMERKIRRLREDCDRLNPDATIEVDGCINETTIPVLHGAGARVFVGGTSGLFRRERGFTDSLRIMRASVGA